MLENLKNYFGINKPNLKKLNKRNISKKINELFSSLSEDNICLQFGDDIVFSADKIVKTIETERERIKEKTGFILPPVRCINNKFLQENQIDILLNGKKIDERYVIPKEDNICEEIINIINELYEQHLYEIFSNELVEKYIERAKINNAKTVTEVCYKLASVEIKYILIDLLMHKKSIKNIVLIFEKISENIFIYGLYENNIERFSQSILTSL